MSNATKKMPSAKAAARAEPSPLTAVRDVLAEYFSAEVMTSVPLVIDVLEDQCRAIAHPGQRLDYRYAIAALFGKSPALKNALARNVRRRFDAEIDGRNDCDAVRRPGEPYWRHQELIDQCTARLRDQCRTEFNALTNRIGELLDRPLERDRANPVHPRLLVSAFHEAVTVVDARPEISAILFKAYGPILLGIAPDVYVQANQMLAERDQAPAAPVAEESTIRNAPVPASPELLQRLLTGSFATAWLRRQRGSTEFA